MKFISFREKREKSVAELYKYHISLITVLISLVIISVFVLVLINFNRNYSNSMLVNILGKQRMLTQMMAKNVGRIYQLDCIISSKDNLIYDNNYITSERTKVLDELQRSTKEYEMGLKVVEEGHILINGKDLDFKGALRDISPVITENQNLWSDFKKSIYIVSSAKYDTPEFLRAMEFIDENNSKLLNYSDEITNIVLNYSNGRSYTIYYIVMALVVLLLLFLAFFIKNAYNHLFIPISQIHRGMSYLGLSKETNSLVRGESEAQEFKEVKIVFNELDSLLTMVEDLNKNISFKDMLKYIFDSFSTYIPYTHIGVALISDDKKRIKASYGMTEKHKNLINRLLGYEMFIHCTSLGNIIESNEERIINDLEEYVSGKPVKEYNKILIEEGIKASITFPLKANNNVLGIIFFSSDTKNVYKKEHIRFLRLLANSLGLSLEKSILIDDLIISTTLSLAKLTEERDSDTGEHLSRMSYYSRMLTEMLSKEDKYRDKIDMDYIESMERFSPLHDIGKVAIRDEILLKPGKLTEEEFEIMKTHAVYGGKVLRLAEENLNKKGRSIFRVAIEIAEGHHEKWDGSGYPYGRAKEDIPLSARVVALADVFDALTSKRPYKEPFSFERSVELIVQGKGKHFDPEIVDVFLKNMDRFRRSYNKFNNIEEVS